jgi:hypothetical protein
MCERDAYEALKIQVELAHWAGYVARFGAHSLASSA